MNFPRTMFLFFFKDVDVDGSSEYLTKIGMLKSLKSQLKFIISKQG